MDLSKSTVRFITFGQIKNFRKGAILRQLFRLDRRPSFVPQRLDFTDLLAICLMTSLVMFVVLVLPDYNDSSGRSSVIHIGADDRPSSARRLAVIMASAADSERRLPLSRPHHEPEHEQQTTKSTGRSLTAAKLNQVERLRLLKNSCRNMPYNPINNATLNIFLSQRLHYVYCSIPKVASTSLHEVLTDSEGVKSTSSSSSSSSTSVTRLNSLSADQLNDFASSGVNKYFKFLFVRHPIQRLVAVYQSMFGLERNLQADWDNRGVREHIKNYIRRAGGDSVITFREFVLFLLVQQTNHSTPSLDSTHWRSYRELCDPCRVGYDFVGHYETLDDDVRLLFDSFDGGVRPRRRLLSPFYDADLLSYVSPDQMDAALEKLSTDEINALRRLYRTDFTMFGYQ